MHKTIVVPDAGGFERARLVALKMSGYAVDPFVAEIKSHDRRYNNRVKRSHHSAAKGEYRFAIER